MPAGPLAASAAASGGAGMVDRSFMDQLTLVFGVGFGAAAEALVSLQNFNGSAETSLLLTNLPIAAALYLGERAPRDRVGEQDA